MPLRISEPACKAPEAASTRAMLLPLSPMLPVMFNWPLSSGTNAALLFKRIGALIVCVPLIATAAMPPVLMLLLPFKVSVPPVPWAMV